jgi:hypothetical protein
MVHQVIGILEWGVFVHMYFGINLVSVPEILSYDAQKYSVVARGFARRSAKFLSNFLMMD